MAEEQRKCIACDGPAQFTANVVLYRLGSSPKATVSSRAFGVCRECCQPDSKSKDEFNMFKKLSGLVGMILWMANNDLEQKVSQSAPDRKTAAAGVEA